MSHWPLQRCTRLRGESPIPHCTSEAHGLKTTQCCWSWEKREFSDSHYGFCDLGRFSVRYRAMFGGGPRPSAYSLRVGLALTAALRDRLSTKRQIAAKDS